MTALLVRMVVGAVFAVVFTLGAAGRAGAADAAPIRDVRPTNLQVGDHLVVELQNVAPRGPAVVILRATSASTEAIPAPLALRGRALGDGRVVAPIDEGLAARLGRDVHWRGVTVEVALTDGDAGETWAATGGHRVWRSAPGETWEIAFFPGSLAGFARRLAGEHGLTIAGRPVPPAVFAGAIMIGVALVVLLLVAPVTGLLVVWERKIAGRMQSRFGPNRVGPRGWLQWLADALKLILKEDLIPTHADHVLFRLSPYLMWMGIFATFVALPLSEAAIVADLNIGLLYLAAVTTLTVVGIIMGGWASNSKWSLLGGMRSAAQIVSYELPASMALLTVVVAAGTLSPQAIVRAQGGWPIDWFLFRSPATFVAFFVYFIAALAEGNRTPFDLPEAESELVAGYHTEYSGFRWSIFQLGEWTNIYVVGGIVATVFLGGWNIPGISADIVARSPALQVLSVAVQGGKVVVLTFVIIWIRWTLPRFRIDQLMALCWKRLLPLAFVLFIVSAAWTWAANDAPRLDLAMRLATFAIGGVGLGLAFAVRVARTFRRTRLLHAGDRQFALPFVERHLEKR
jgi:NADH:ubiquinone oxidoreductase subunit H